MKFCTNCGAQIPEGSKFCTECGQKIQQPVPQAPVAAPPPAPVTIPVVEAPAKESSAQTHVYGEPVNHNFSAPAFTESKQSVVHTYGAPVNHNFSAPVQTEAALSGTYGGAAPAIPAKPAPAPKPEPVAVPAAAPVRQESGPAAQPVPAAVQQPVESGSYAAPVMAQTKPPKAPREKTGGGRKLPKPVLIGIAAVVVVILLVAIFSGGGGNKNDPNLGRYNAVSCVYSGVELGAEGEWIELNSGGKFTMKLMGDEYSGKWELDGEDLTVKQAGDTYYGTLKDGTIVLDLGGMVYTYVNEHYEAPDPGTDAPKATVPKPQEVSAAGYWTLLKSEGDSSMAMDEETVQHLKELGIEIYLDLKADGTGVFMIEEAMNITWDQEKLTDDIGDTYTYTLENGQLILNVDDAVMTFVPGEGGAPQVIVPGVEDPEESLDDPILNFWEGDWYGWWVVWSGDGIYDSMEDEGMDAYAHIDVNADYTGTVTLWDVDSSRSDPVAVVDVSFRSGVSEYGCMVSESGWFKDCEVAHADWNLDVGASMVRMFDSMIAIDSYYYDPADSDNSYNYVFILRPWGMEWEDVRDVNADGTYYADMMPFAYEDWYLPLLEGGVEYLPDSYEAGLNLIG